jgi:hypothetical protein
MVHIASHAHCDLVKQHLLGTLYCCLHMQTRGVSGAGLNTSMALTANLRCTRQSVSQSLLACGASNQPTNMLLQLFQALLATVHWVRAPTSHLHVSAAGLPYTELNHTLQVSSLQASQVAHICKAVHLSS